MTSQLYAYKFQRDAFGKLLDCLSNPIDLSNKLEINDLTNVSKCLGYSLKCRFGF